MCAASAWRARLGGALDGCELVRFGCGSALLVRAGEVVPSDALAEVMWDGAPPTRADITLRSHVSRLRQVLGPAAGARVVTRFRGYAVQAGADEVDLSRFRLLTRDGGAAVQAGEWGAPGSC